MKSLHFFKGLSWLIALNILIKPLWIFAIDRQVQNVVGYREYGAYFSILNLSLVLSFIADAGLTNMMNRQLAFGNSSSFIRFHRLLFLKFSLLFLYGASICCVAWLTHVTRWDIVLPVIYIQAITSLFLFLRNIITAHQLFTTDAWLSVVDKLLMILICGIFIFSPLLFGQISLRIFLYSQMFCTTVAVVVAIIIISLKKLLTDNGAAIDIRPVFLSVAPFAVIILLMSAHNRLDGFLLERIHANGAYEAGVYASAYRLLDAGNMAGYLTASFLVPFIARNKMDHGLIKTTVLNLRHALLLSGIAGTAFTIALAPLIEQVLYHTHDFYNIQILQWCIAVLPAYFLTHIYSSLLTAMGQFKMFISTLIICLLVNVLINIFLIPSQGAFACCIAALISQYMCAFALLIIASKHNNISLHAPSLLLYAVTGICSFLFFFFVQRYL